MPSLHAHHLRFSAPAAPAGVASPVGVRARVLLHRGRLDAQLAAGEAPGGSPELALRASQLTSEHNRQELAATIERLVRVAHGTAVRRSASPPLARHDVRACSRQLMDLARLLRSRPEVGAAGVALIQRLLTDGTGPLYQYGENDALWHAVGNAGIALVEAHP